MNREQLIKFIPKPYNSDVIIYDVSLSDLIDVDVFKEYDEFLPIFLKKRQQYELLNDKINQYKNSIDNIYLYKKNWTKEDYLQALQNNKKTYSTLYNDIKKIENNIDILQKKIKVVDEKIQIQIAKEERAIEKRKKDIDINIDKNKDKLLNLKNKLNDSKLYYEKVQEQILDNNDEFHLLIKMQDSLMNGTCKCEMCGHVIKNCSEDSRIYKKTIQNLEKNKNELQSLLEKKNKAELDIAYYENEILDIKSELQNDIYFKKNTNNFYTKKTIEVLKLEALRDEIVNNIDELKKQLRNKPELNTKKYLELKETIDKYQISFDNLNKIEQMKTEIQSYINKFNILKEELKEDNLKIQDYIKFIKIYYKIYEKKAAEYFGPDFSFKIFKFNEYTLEKIFQIYYKGIEYSQLDEKDKEKIDRIFIEKLSIYN